MDNIVHLRPERRSTLASRHLEYFETSHGWLSEQLSLISAEQLAVEQAELHRLMEELCLTGSRGALAVQFAYMDKVERLKGFGG